MDRTEARTLLNRWSAADAPLPRRGGLGDRCDLDQPVADPACVATLTTFYERRETEWRVSPYRGEPLATGDFAGIWEHEAGPVRPFAEEERVFPVPGTEEVEICDRCSGRGSETCHHCGGARSLECWDCGGALSFTCDSCGGSGGEDCYQCGSTGSHTCSTCGGAGSISYTDTEGYTPPCPGCDGSRQVSCGACRGSGGGRCVRCGGSGELMCGTCDGSGRARCPECAGKGAHVCSRCDGAEQIRRWLALVVRFEVVTDSRASGGGDVPTERLARAGGRTLETPDGEDGESTSLARMLSELREQHASSPRPDGGARVLEQRFHGKEVPVWRVPFKLRGRKGPSGDFSIYGREREVWTPIPVPRHVDDLRWFHFQWMAIFATAWSLLWLVTHSPWWQGLLILAVIAGAAALVNAVGGKLLDRQGAPWDQVGWVRMSLGFPALFLTTLHFAAVPFLWRRMDRSVALLAQVGIRVPLSIRDPKKASDNAYREGLRLLKLKGRDRDAAAAFGRAINLAPGEHYPARYRLGWLYLRFGDLYAAQLEFERVARGVPNTPEGAEARKQLKRITAQRARGRR